MKVKFLNKISMRSDGRFLSHKKGDIVDLDAKIAKILLVGKFVEVVEEAPIPPKNKRIAKPVVIEPLEETVQEVVEQDAVPTK